MNFSVTINGRVFTQADFAGFAYLAGLPDSVEKMGEVAELGGAISVNVTAPAEGTTVTRTLPTNLPILPSEFLMFFNTATVDERTFATVLSYDSSTGSASLRFDKHAGVVNTDVLNRMMLSPGARLSSVPALSQRGFGYNDPALALNGATRVYSPSYGMQELNFQASGFPYDPMIGYSSVPDFVPPFDALLSPGSEIQSSQPFIGTFSASAAQWLTPSVQLGAHFPGNRVGLYHGSTGYYSPAESGPALFTATIGHHPFTTVGAITEIGLAPRVGDENPFSGMQIGFYFGQGPDGIGWYAVIRGRTLSRFQFLGITGLDPVFLALYVNPRGDEVHWYITQSGALSALKTPTYSLALSPFFGERTAGAEEVLFAPAIHVRKSNSAAIIALLSSMTFSVALNRN